MEKSDPKPRNNLRDPIQHPNHNADPIPASSFHRRSQSDDISMFMNPFSCGAQPSSDDLFSSFIDVDSFAANQNPSFSSSISVSGANPRHRHSNSVDAIYGTGEIMDAKKTIQTRTRASYSVASNTSNYSLLSSLSTSDTDGLANENAELKLRLQAMEQQAQFRKSLNEALRKEVERMKIETGEISGSSDSFDMGMHYSFMANPPYHSSMNGQDMKIHRSFNPMEMSNSQRVSEFLQNGRLQGLEISGNSSISLVKSEGSSVSGGESSSGH